ncbi:MAG TPA: phosphoadenosine phosphosulfate reductase family protein [Candidatus Binatia bacterium]|nr:phosphoadenosine phosphosulfate reductase family protein [Candidatus Binatia bacterium]
MNALPRFKLQFDQVNRDLGHDPEALVRWAIGLGERSIVTTSFGPFAAVTLHLVTQAAPNVPVVWIDSGYGTPETYRFADQLAKRLNLDLRIYRPRRSRAHREAVDGPTPAVGDPRHAEFTRELKLEPFGRVTAELKPKVWITGIRADETAERAAMQPVSINPDGILKVAPVLHWTARDMHQYLKQHGLPNNFDYVDPTKGDEHRECGLHLAH